MSDQQQSEYEEKYTHPEMRHEIKDELMESDKGGRPGQWSARKAQLLVQEYERRGGGYKKDTKDADAKSLETLGFGQDRGRAPSLRKQLAPTSITGTRATSNATNSKS